MERDYSWSFVPFQAVCVHSEFPGNRATDPNRKYTCNPTDFCGGTAQLARPEDRGAVTWAVSALGTDE